MTNTNYSMLQPIVNSGDEYVPVITKDLSDLLKHDFLAKVQSKYIDNTKQFLQPGVFLALCDFGEYFTNVIQDVIQNHYWCPAQVTIHPFVV